MPAAVALALALFLVAARVPACMAASGCQKFTRSNHTCYEGNTYKHVDATDYESCCAACSNTSECTHFTLNTDDISSHRACRLKNAQPGVASSSNKCTSGLLQAPAPSPSPPDPNAPRPNIGAFFIVLLYFFKSLRRQSSSLF